MKAFTYHQSISINNEIKREQIVTGEDNSSWNSLLPEDFEN